jgi:hypothetical protein
MRSLRLYLFTVRHKPPAAIEDGPDQSLSDDAEDLFSEHLFLPRPSARVLARRP